MKIYKEKAVNNPLFSVLLENDVIIEVFNDHTVSTDGNRYYHVGREEEGILLTVGWSCDITENIILE